MDPRPFFSQEGDLIIPQQKRESDNSDNMVLADDESLKKTEYGIDMNLQQTQPPTSKEDMLKKIFHNPPFDVSSYSEINFLKERISSLEEHIANMEKLFAKEVKEDKEILKEISTLEKNENKKGEKQDPFKMAKGLLAMSKEEYQRLLEEDWF